MERSRRWDCEAEPWFGRLNARSDHVFYCHKYDYYWRRSLDRERAKRVMG